MIKLNQHQRNPLGHQGATLLLLCSLATTYPSICQALTFTDDFNRPDSATVGNGWSDTSGNVSGNLGIKNNELICSVSPGHNGIFRPFPFTAPITISAKVKEQNGFGTLLRRYAIRFLLRNDGILGHGYGVFVGRSDQTENNSTVILVEDGIQLASVPSTFQYGPEIHVSVTFNLDGSVTGTVSEPAPSTNTFNFSFGPRTIQSTGDNFSIDTDCSAGPVDPRIDDVAIMSDTVDACVATLPFQWPTVGANGLMGQDYAAFNGGPERWRNHYHTGIDIRARLSGGSRINEDVLAIAAGEVEAICPNGLENGNGENGCVFGGTQFSRNPGNHGLQGVVILKHLLPTGQIVHSLYGHLQTVGTFSAGECISPGAKLGVTGAEQDKHLHFEIKNDAVLHNPVEDQVSCTNRNTGISFSRCWGYTLTHPDNYGYHDPVTYFHDITTSGFPRLVDVTEVITERARPRVRVGPGGLSDKEYRVINNAPLGEYEALGKAPGTSVPDCPGGWYNIRREDFDCSVRGNCFREDGGRAGSLVPDGWVCSIFVIE